MKQKNQYKKKNRYNKRIQSLQFKGLLAQNYMGPSCLHDLPLGPHLRQAGVQGQGVSK